jgi:hypothetical protein
MQIDLDLLQTPLSRHKTKLAQQFTPVVNRRAFLSDTKLLQCNKTSQLLSLTSRNLPLLNKISKTIMYDQHATHRHSLRRLPQRIKPLLKLAPHIRTLKLIDTATMTLGIPTLILSAHPLPPRRRSRLQTLVVPPTQILTPEYPRRYTVSTAAPILQVAASWTRRKPPAVGRQ